MLLLAKLASFVGVTLSGTNVALEAADLSTFGTAIGGMAQTLLGIFIDLVPYVLILTAVGMAIAMISKYLRIRGKRGGKRR